MVVYEKEIPETLINDRKARNEDARVRYTLGLRYLGLRYGPYNTDPAELYANSQGAKFIRVKLGVYRQVIA